MAHEIDAELTEMVEQEMFAEWVEVGVAAGWISMPDCGTHQSIPLREWEEAEVDEGGDPCIIVARVWMDGYKRDGDER